jgi:hypothetical protein
MSGNQVSDFGQTWATGIVLHAIKSAIKAGIFIAKFEHVKYQEVGGIWTQKRCAKDCAA